MAPKAPWRGSQARELKDTSKAVILLGGHGTVGAGERGEDKWQGVGDHEKVRVNALYMLLA